MNPGKHLVTFYSESVRHPRDEVLSAIMDIQLKLPFLIISFNTDNGTWFLNRNLYMHFAENKLIEFTMSRPYKKNDNCHIEQKNWTHVRENLGYERYDLIELREIIKSQITKLNSIPKVSLSLPIVACKFIFSLWN